MLILANGLVFFACSKSDKDESQLPAVQVETPKHLKGWQIPPKVDLKQPYMVFATEATERLRLSLITTSENPNVWVDTNNNGVFDEGTDVRATDFTQPLTFKATAKVFTVYGKVKELIAIDNSLTAADVRANPDLTKLNVADNKLSEEALLSLITELPAATEQSAMVWRATKGDKNQITTSVREALANRGWKALCLNEKGAEAEDKEVPSSEDTEVPEVGEITEATATAFNTIRVKWTAATDSKTAQEKLRYQVLYHVKGLTEVQQSEVVENKLDYLLTGLTENTTYEVKVKVIDEAGNAAEYLAKEVNTPVAPVEADKIAPRVGGIIEATATAFNTINLRWMPATDDKTAQDRLRYQVLYNVKESAEVRTSELTENMLSYTLGDLTENTTYVIKLKVWDEANNVAEYEAQEVTTPADASKASQEFIQFTTEKGKGEKIWLDINAASEDRKEVWIDLNGNGKWEEGIDAVPTAFVEKFSYTLQASTIRVYGKVTALICYDEQLTAVDFTQNKVLKQLYALGNKLSTITNLTQLEWLALNTATLQSNNMDLPKLAFLSIKQTTPIETVRTTTLPHLKELIISKCTGITRLDLSQNTALNTLRANQTGLTTLDLSAQTKLNRLEIAGCSITQLTVANAPLHYVDVRFIDGKGIREELLTRLIYQLPIQEYNKRGLIKVSQGQLSADEKKILTDKYWEIEEDKGMPSPSPNPKPNPTPSPNPVPKPIEDKDAPTLGTIKFTHITYNHANVVWDAGRDRVTLQNELRYQLFLYKADRTTLVEKSEEKENMLSHSLAIDLRTHSSYWVKVTVKDKAGNTAAYTAELKDTEAPKAGVIEYIKPLNQHTAQVKWEYANDNVTEGSGHLYQVFWQEVGVEKVESLHASVANIRTIENLKANTQYRVWVEAKDQAGNKVLYPFKEFRTPVNREDVKEFIELTTQYEIGKTISLTINAEEKDKDGVWVDLNANGRWDEGIDAVPIGAYGDGIYELASQTIRIYGKVTKLSCYSNRLLTLDFSHNKVLRKLYVPGNYLTSIANLTQLDELSVDTSVLKNHDMNLPNLIHLSVNETTNIATVNTSKLTKLKELSISGYQGMTSLDLSKNTALEDLQVVSVNFTVLDLSVQPNLSGLNISGSPFQVITLAKDVPLKYLEIRRRRGREISQELRTQLINKLPTWRRSDPGYIKVSKGQLTAAEKKILADKHWDIEELED